MEARFNLFDKLIENHQRSIFSISYYHIYFIVVAYRHGEADT